MIQFTQLKAKDCFSYKELDFTFNEGLHSISGVNGSSKTSIFLTLCQGLFNKNPKNCKVDEVNNSITQEKYSIEVFFTKGPDSYRVLNSRKLGTVQLFKNDRDISLTRIPDTLALISEVLEADYHLFTDLIYQSKNSTLNILDSSTNLGRSAFVNRILKLSELDGHLQRIQERRKELEGKNGSITNLQKTLELLEAQISEPGIVGAEVAIDEELLPRLRISMQDLHTDKFNLESKLKEVKQQCADYANCLERQQTITDKELALNSLAIGMDPEVATPQIEDLRVKISSDQAKMATYSAALVFHEKQQATRIAIADKQAQLKLLNTFQPKDKVELQLKEAQQTVATVSERLKRVKTEYDKLSAAAKEGTCPTCGHDVDTTKFDIEIAELKALGNELKANLATNKETIALCKEELETWEALETLNTGIALLQAGLGDDTFDVEDGKQQVQTLAAAIDLAQGQIRLLKEETTIFNKRKTAETELSLLKAASREYPEVLEGEVEKWQDRFDRAKAGIASLEIEIAEAEVTTKKSQEHNANVRAMKALNAQIEAQNTKVKLQLDQTQKELEEAEGTLEHLKTWVGILGPKGYRTAKIAKFLKSLNHTMVKYSRLMCEGKILCRFYVNEKGEITFDITDSAKTQDITLWSGGESARIKIVCLFAVLELLEVMGSVSFNVFCADEIFDALDSEGKEGLFNVLEYLKKKNKALYTIAHSELALDMVYDSVIKAEKLSDGTTRIIQ